MMNIHTYLIVADTMREHVSSARPDAPTVPERPPRNGVRVERARRLTARTLRRLADRVEPCPRAVAIS
jgi:hypothetical protein